MPVNWCPSCRTPVVEKERCSCGEKTRCLSTDARPVFPEERYLLYLLTGNDAYLSRAVWAGKGYRYFLDGAANKEPLTELIQTADTDRIRLSLLGVSFDDMYSRFDSEVERFVDTNVDHTRDLEYAAEYAIRDAVEKHASFLPVVSFSGGKDSTVVSSLVSRFGKSFGIASLWRYDTRVSIDARVSCEV